MQPPRQPFRLGTACQFKTAGVQVQSVASPLGRRRIGFNSIYFQLTQLKSGQPRGLEGVLKATTRDSRKAGISNVALLIIDSKRDRGVASSLATCLCAFLLAERVET